VPPWLRSEGIAGTRITGILFSGNESFVIYFSLSSLSKHTYTFENILYLPKFHSMT